MTTRDVGCWDQPRKLHVCPGRYGIGRVRGNFCYCYLLRRKGMDIRVPEELQPILRDFTKAVLRDRPDDVLQYSRQYFIARWTEERMGEHHTHNYVLLRAAAAVSTDFDTAHTLRLSQQTTRCPRARQPPLPTLRSHSRKQLSQSSKGALKHLLAATDHIRDSCASPSQVRYRLRRGAHNR